MKELGGWWSPRFLDPSHRFLPWINLGNIIFATVIGVLSAMAGFIADSTTRGALMLSSDDARWISISFIMMLGIILPLAVFLAERYGYKTIFFMGLVIFSFGSLCNSLAFDFISLLLSRAMAGIGAGALFPLSIAMIDRSFPKEKLGVALALYVGLGFGVGMILGFFIGGYFVQYISWQAPFFLCFLLSMPSLLMTGLFFSEQRPTQKRPFDMWGYLAFVVFLSNLLLILNSAKAAWNTEGWTSNFILTCVVIMILSLIALIGIELKTSNPLIVFALFRKKSFLLGCSALFLVGISLYSAQLLSVTFLDQDLRYAKHTMGLLLTTTGITLGVFSTLAACLTQFVNIRLLALIGMSLICITCWASSSLTLYSSSSQMLWLWNIRMVGISFALGPATALAMSEIGPAFSGAASLFITLARQVGGTIGSLSVQLITVERQEFHKTMFGSQIDPLSPAFQDVVRNLQSHLTRQGGVAPSEAYPKAVGLVRANLLTQSHVTSMNDAYYILALALGVVCLALLFEMAVGYIEKKTLGGVSHELLLKIGILKRR